MSRLVVFGKCPVCDSKYLYMNFDDFECTKCHIRITNRASFAMASSGKIKHTDILLPEIFSYFNKHEESQTFYCMN